MSPLLEVRDLKKYFKVPAGILHAVDGVSFSINRGRTIGIVGESGCGKSTLGRLVIHLLECTSGSIVFEGKDISSLNEGEIKKIRPDMQMIFQDPFSSLNPRQTVGEIIAEPLTIYRRMKDRYGVIQEVLRLMDTVGIARTYLNSYPHELDGGRRQRIGIARALSLNPKFIVCDEPISALDVSIQAQILNLMQDLQEDRNLTYMFITHNLAVVRHISDQIMVMYTGNMVEMAAGEELFKNRLHPYTKALLAAVPLPVVTGEKRKRQILKGELSSPINPSSCCRFAGRCEYAKEHCFNEQPAFNEILPGHFVACHFTSAINTIKEQ
jgi:peptide/nickel transport system ATP-binding protein